MSSARKRERERGFSFGSSGVSSLELGKEVLKRHVFSLKKKETRQSSWKREIEGEGRTTTHPELQALHVLGTRLRRSNDDKTTVPLEAKIKKEVSFELRASAQGGKNSR